MHSKFYIVLFTGFFSTISYAAYTADRFELTADEQTRVNNVITQYNIKPRVDDKTCMLTEKMVKDMPVSAIKKMLAHNEAYIEEDAHLASPEEIARLTEEVRIFKQVLNSSESTS